MLIMLIMAAQFAVFELALRAWGSSEAAPAFQGLFIDDPSTGFRMKPGARVRFTTAEFDTQININRAGVRDDEELGPKEPNERRIVILGDSLVLSVQVPLRQTFGKLLEQRLNARGSTVRYRVINAGVQGYGPVQELLLFKNMGASLQPDIVIETLFVGNDAEDAYAAQSALYAPEQTRARGVSEALTTRLRRTVRRSMVLQLLRLRLVSATSRFTTTLARPEPPVQTYAANPPPRIAEGLQVTRECVRRIAEYAAGLHARTALLLMPARFQVDDADYGRMRLAVSQAGGELVRDAASTRFRAALGDLGLPMMDALAPLRAAPPGPDLFFRQTVHLTPRGHEVVAEALERFLLDADLVDDRRARPR
jgi:hypothetical protein